MSEWLSHALIFHFFFFFCRMRPLVEYRIKTDIIVVVDCDMCINF